MLCLSWTEPALMPNVIMSGTLFCYVSWTEPALMPNVVMSGTLVMSLGQSQPVCQMSLCLVHLFLMSLMDRANPYAKCPYVWYTCLFCLPYVLSPLCQMSLCLVHLFVMSVLNRARPLCQMSLCLVHLCVMSVLDKISLWLVHLFCLSWTEPDLYAKCPYVCFSWTEPDPYAKCPYGLYTCVLCLSWTEPDPYAKCPYVWYTCYVSLGQSQTHMPNGKRRRKWRSQKRRNPMRKNWKSKAVFVTVCAMIVWWKYVWVIVAYVTSRVISLHYVFSMQTLTEIVNSDAWSSVWAYVLEWYDYVNWAFNSVIVRNAYDAMYSSFHWEKEMHTLSHKEDPNLQICWIEWWPGFDWPLKACIWLTTLKVDCQWRAFSVTDTLKVDCQWLAFSC